MHTDAAFSTYEDELQTLVAVEQTVAPYGPSLIDLYFRNVHPSFPILQKHTFMDRHRCGDRQFHSGLLAGMYLLALRWWNRDPVLSQHPKPSVYRLEELAARSLSMAMQHPKLSALQAGLLLLQRRQSTDWGLTVQLVALAQDLGLHIDCTNWDIPVWERRLRKRLAWALYMQDKWTALVHGRPSHIQAADWAVSALSLDDFNEEFENADQQMVVDDENEEEEKSRVIFIQMIELTSIMAEVIDVFYTQRANAEFERGGRNATRLILERAKPVQLKLKEWFSKLPAVARMDAYTPGKLSSNVPLLQTVGGKQHATAKDHEPDDKRAPDSSDDDSDNDTSGLGGLPPKKPNRLRVPQRTNRNPSSSIVPAKREAESGDELDSLVFSQSSQSKRPLKTFGKKSFKARDKVARQQEKTASAFRETPAVQPKPEPPKKKAGFRTTLPAPEPPSSQADAPQAASGPTFRHLTTSAADSTDVSGQSQPIVLESSQLSPPPSSPISSVCDFDFEEIVEEPDKSPRCPICSENIEQEFWDKFQDEILHRRMNLRLQEKFCLAHKARTADDVWQDKGYPKIDWSILQPRLGAHHAHINAILDGDYESPYYKQHAKLVSQTKGHSARSAAVSGRFTGLRAGYYGTKGEKIIGASGGVSGYVHAILVPEMALGLIMEDMDCDRERARTILADSADIGEMFNAEEDEKVQRVEIDLDTSGINDDSEIVYTQTPKKGFRLA
ncbi:unnamed protein product [Aureobasidium vineae]|uniref:Transcription factor domain-containing protein n=1 Tax=Aureobasidium vineae TaxID=2773715 RepID=A0A9N8JRI9_9PEZI|nr:unnamed protein product [Aureobasidium vineae]